MHFRYFIISLCFTR